MKGPFPLTGALTGRPPYRRPLTSYRKAYGKLRGETLPELGGNFRLCAVDQKRPFFPRAVLFLDLPPFKGPFPLTGALTGKPPYRGPYGQTALREGPLRGGFLREGPLRVTGKLAGSYGEGLYQNWAGISGPKKVVFFLKLGRFWTFCPLRDLSLLQGPLRADRLTGRFLTALCPFRDLALLQGPLRANRLTGRPLTGRLLTRRPPTNYRKAYGKLRGGTLPELGGNFRLCAVDQKRSFFPRVGPFLDLLPFKGPFPLTGALTGRPPYGKVPYGQTALREGPLRGGFLREGPPRITGKLTEATGRDFTRIGREFPLVRRRPKKKVVFFLGLYRFWTFCPLRDLSPLQGPLRADRLTGRFLTGRPPYGKAPYGEASYEKAPHELQESLREATGRDFTRIGREFPLVRRRPKKVVFFLGLYRFWTFCPLRDLSPLQGPLRADRFLTRRPLTGRLLTRRPLTNYRKAYRKLRGGTLPELGGNFRLCAVDQKKGRFFLGLGRFWTFCPLRDLSPLQGPLRQTALREGSLRADRLTGRPLTGRLLTRRPPTNYRKAYGKLRGGTLPELGGNFRLCAVDQKKPFFPRVVPFLDLLPFQGPFPLAGAHMGRPVSYEKAPYELQESLREATGRDFTRIGREFPLVRHRPKKVVFFLGLCRFWTFCPLRDLSPLQGPLRADSLTGRPLTGRLLTGRLLWGISYGRHL